MSPKSQGIRDFNKHGRTCLADRQQEAKKWVAVPGQGLLLSSENKADEITDDFDLVLGETI